jgi:hypothetical protein
MSPIYTQLIDDNQIGYARKSVPTPFLAIMASKPGEEAGQDHDDIRDDGYQYAGSIEAGQQTQVQK